jgi:hypothetical protein
MNDIQIPFNNKIFRLENYITSIPGNGIEESGIRFVHHFAKGTYAKEMIVPADVWITGKAHKTEHLSIFLEGKMIVAMPDGSKEIEAPIVEIGRAGIKRAGYTLEPVRWITVHATHETDIDVLEDMLVTNDPQALLDNDDYEAFCIDYGMTNEVIEVLESIDVKNLESDKVELRPSPRHGTGVFSKGQIKIGEFIAHAIKDGELIQWSRYTNHSILPNARMAARSQQNIDIIAIRDIDEDEITVNYRTTMWAELPVEVAI